MRHISQHSPLNIRYLLDSAQLTVVAPTSDNHIASLALSAHHTLETLVAWMENPDSFPATKFTKKAPSLFGHYDVAYNLETGKLELSKYNKIHEFDPDSEESLAKLIRKLKTEAFSKAARDNPEPKLGLPTPALPQPTAEQLAKATRLAQVASASGIPSYSKPRQRYNQPAASAVRSQELARAALDKILSARKA